MTEQERKEFEDSLDATTNLFLGDDIEEPLPIPETKQVWVEIADGDEHDHQFIAGWQEVPLTAQETTEAAEKYNKEAAYYDAVRAARKHTKIESSRVFRGTDCKEIAGVLMAGRYVNVSKTTFNSVTIFIVVTLHNAETEYYCDDVSKLPTSAVGLSVISPKRQKSNDGMWHDVVTTVVSEDGDQLSLADGNKTWQSKAAFVSTVSKVRQTWLETAFAKMLNS